MDSRMQNEPHYLRGGGRQWINYPIHPLDQGTTSMLLICCYEYELNIVLQTQTVVELS